MKIDELAIPEEVKEELKEDGITTLYPPQEKAIKQGVLEGNNLVVAIPTASGKTLLALLAAAKIVEETGYKVLYLSPLRALAYEKYNEFRNYFSKMNKQTVLLTGDYDVEDYRANYGDIIIATNEKIDSAIRHQSKWLRKIGLVISDEVHLINSRDRGPTLEVVLAQLKKQHNMQILALSATIKNADEIARWLEAQLVSSTWRPVKLNEGVAVGSRIIYKGKKEKKIPTRYKDTFLNIIEFILREKNQALVFCTTRRMTESTANKISSEVQKTLALNEKQELMQASKEILRHGEKTKQSEEVAGLIITGVAFHHAGLNSFQRRTIEEQFKKGNLKIIAATPTLAAGVNMPARYVIIKSIYRYSVTLGSHPIPVLEFKQQSGRAGRPQYDKEGDALVIAKDQTTAEELYQRYIIAETENIESRLAAEPALRSIALGQIATENTKTEEELLEFFSETFYGYQQNPASLSTILKTVIEFLKEEALIVQDPEYLIPTKFGKRTSQLYIDPKSAVIIRDGLIRANTMAKQLLKDISFLHLVCTTPDVRFITARQDDQMPLMNFINNHEDEIITELPRSAFEIELFMSQLKTALIIRDWILEVPEDTILERYSIGSGDIYSIVSNAEWLLYATGEIAELLGYTMIASRVKILHERLVSGIKEELLELVQIPGIGRARARTLFDAGFKTQELLRKAKPEEIINLPRFGTEITRRIIEHVTGKKVSEETITKLRLEDDYEETLIEDNQKSLDEFF